MRMLLLRLACRLGWHDWTGGADDVYVCSTCRREVFQP